MRKKRVTPIEEFERFAERMYNFNPYIQTKLEFDKTYDEYMGGMIRGSAFKDKTWDIMKDKFIKEVDEKDSKLKGKKGKTVSIRKPKEYDEKHLARVWDNKNKHYKVQYVRKVEDKKGVIRYKKGRYYVQVDKVKYVG